MSLRMTVARTVAGVARLYPFYSGCGTLANSAVLRAFAHSPSPVVTRVRGGGEMLVDLEDYVGRSVFYFGDIDRKVSWVCRRVLRRGETFVDVGANQGLVTILGASLVGPTGRVIAFEPQENLAALLATSITRASLAHASVQRVGLSDSNAQVRFFVPEDNSGAASVGEGDGRAGRHLTIPLRKGDEVFRELNVSGVRLMKVDVEGHETGVFAGLSDTLRAHRIDAIVFESNKPGEVLGRSECRLLTDAGYRIAEIPRSLLRPRVRWLGDGEGSGGHDFFASAPTGPGKDAARAVGLAV